MSKRIQSVVELARYDIGDIVYCVMLRPKAQMPTLPEEDKWMEHHHPKALYTIGPAKRLWPFFSKLPRLHHTDFENVVNLLRSAFVVEGFEICEIIRSKDTGEFFYSNNDDEWMPEECLMGTKLAAEKEKRRILRLFKKWADKSG